MSGNASDQMSISGLARRSWLKGAAAVASTCMLGDAAAEATSSATKASPAVAGVGDEARWAKVAAEFPRNPPLMNLNNASIAPHPRVVLDALIEAEKFSNELPDVHMWEVQDAARPRIKQKLAALLDCSPQEVALNQNATAGLSTAIHGIDLRAGDEVVLCDWDYDAMRYAWEQRARREGIRLVHAKFDLLDDDAAIVDAYRRALSDRTKVMHITHVVHYTGRTLPARELCELARPRGIQTIVDAAQSVGQMPVSFRQLGCDYLAASLHKWLCAPFGTGVLLAREPRAEALWTLLAPWVEAPRGIDKFDASNLGGASVAAEVAIDPALDFHNRIGAANIHARLRHLSRYWVEQARDIQGFRLHTRIDEPNTNALVLFSIDGVDSTVVERRLRDEHRIRIRYRSRGSLTGVRVSPHIYTTAVDLDRFVAALRSISRSV